jgi:hypothetical protein
MPMLAMNGAIAKARIVANLMAVPFSFLDMPTIAVLRI